MAPSKQADSDEILIVPPTRRDGEIAFTELRSAGLKTRLYQSVEPVCACIAAGTGGVAILAEETLTSQAVQALQSALQQQPAWSDFPLLVLASTRAHARSGDRQNSKKRGALNLSSLGNVTLLEPPLRVRFMINAVRVALRGRVRQYEARRAIEKRDSFLAMLGHELRNPLSAIVLALEAVALGNQKGLDVIRRQSSQLTHLVNDLLDVARVTSGRIELRIRSIELGEALTQTVDSLRERIEASGLTLECDIESGVVVDGDSARLEQVFGNLLTNALKYTPAGGTIQLTMKRLDQQAVIVVKDSGVGLSPSSLEHIFEQFVQVESTLARAQGGLGIGLTLARTLVQLHGGSITAQSDGEGHGSKFTVHLPLADASRPSRATPPGPEALPTEGRSIVVVEDNDDLRDLLVSLLLKKGQRVRSANNGHEGLALLLDPETEAGVIDIGLPQLDGYEVAARARQARGRALRLVALTGYGQATDRARALKAGFDEHLPKPPDINRLLMALEVDS